MANKKHEPKSGRAVPKSGTATRSRRAPATVNATARRCRVCGRSQAVTEYYRYNQSTCKKCVTMRSREWYRRNRAYARERRRRIREMYPEQVREAERRWRKNNPGKQEEYHRRWRNRPENRLARTMYQHLRVLAGLAGDR